MNYYLNKLYAKIKSKKASILFIGQNDFSTELAINVSRKGSQVYFYYDTNIVNIDELLDNNVHLTTLVYDVFDVDFILFSKPSVTSTNEIGEYITQKTTWINQFFHSGITVLVDSKLTEILGNSLRISLENAAYSDPASPLIQNYKVNENYFYCEFDSSFEKMRIISDNEELINTVTELLRETK